MILPLDKWLNSTVKIAVDAGNAILKYYQDPSLKVAKKSDSSPITEADLAAHNIITDQLTKLTPEIPVLSEESDIPATIPLLNELFWLVDPLDGTKEFINETNEFTVNIALIYCGTPILGVVHVPYYEQCYAGYKQLENSESYIYQTNSNIKNGINTKKITTDLTQHTLKVVMSRRHGKTKLNYLLQQLKTNFANIDTLSVGSSLKICLVASGAADLYPRLGPTHLWDTAAAHAVLLASGGELLNQTMKSLVYQPKLRLDNPFFFAIGDVTIDWQSIISI